MSDDQCTCDGSEFSASAIYTGENRLVRVVGVCGCPTPGFNMTLQKYRGNPGPVPHPEVLALELNEKAPSDVVSAVVTSVGIDEVFDVTGEVSVVSITTSRGHGFRLQVQEPAPE